MTVTSPSVDRAARTEVVVPRVGPIRVSGHLTLQGADLVRGTVESVRRTGAPCVVVDLAGVRAADDAGLDALHSLRDSFSGRGARLLLCNEPGTSTA